MRTPVYGYDSVLRAYRLLPLQNGKVPVTITPIPVTGNQILSVTTANPGSNFTAYPSYVCNTLVLLNYTDYALDARLNGAGNAITIPALQTYRFTGLTNANQVSIRRNDQNNTPLTLNSEALTA